jgi:DNA-directed RNA polymerase subunit RPC12/RpoP
MTTAPTPEIDTRPTPRVYICITCGEQYTDQWVAYWGRRCHVECDHELVLTSGDDH